MQNWIRQWIVLFRFTLLPAVNFTDEKIRFHWKHKFPVDTHLLDDFSPVIQIFSRMVETRVHTKGNFHQYGGKVAIAQYLTNLHSSENTFTFTLLLSVARLIFGYLNTAFYRKVCEHTYNVIRLWITRV